MTRRYLSIFLLIPAILLGDFTKTYHFSEDDLIITSRQNFHHIQIKNFEQTARPGVPQMPFLIDHLNIDNQLVDSLVIVNANYQKIAGKFNLFPVQKPAILSRPVNSFKAELLSSVTQFPEQPAELLHTGKIANQLITSARIFPLHYNAQKQELSLLKDITLKFITRPAGLTKASHTLTLQHKKIIDHLTLSRGNQLYSSSDTDKQEYIIITSQSLEPCFRPLAEWKMRKGLAAAIMTTEVIDSLYSGVDLQEKIRHFIKESHYEKSSSWILLGGDTNIIPDRKAWAFDCEADYAEGENDIPCDLYYSDLDGNWNDDGDDIFGEVEDSIDIYPDVFVGRAPVENRQEAAAFVNKLLVYEKAITRDYQTNMLFLAQVLWGNPYTDSGESKDFIDERYVPRRFDPIAKLYQSMNNVSTAGIVEEINSGANIINHNGHAWFSIMSVGNGSLGYNEMRNLTNQNKYGIMYSIGCWPAAFDKNAVAEDFITNPNGGGVAFVGNSRYGWGSPGNPLFGYSDRFDQEFFRQLFHNDIHHIGATLAATKAFYAPLSARENVYRWCQYELNLLGDPEMMIFTDIPKDLTLEFPRTVSEGEQQFTILATDESGPVPHCTVCLYQPEGIYFVGETGADGLVNFTGTISGTADKIYLTATAHNYVPFEDSLQVSMEAAFLTPTHISHTGLFDGTKKILQDIPLTVDLLNTGRDTSKSVILKLSSENSSVRLIDSIAGTDILMPEDSCRLRDAFRFQVNADFAYDEIFDFTLNIQDQLRHHWRHHFSIRPEIPQLSIENFIVRQKQLMPGDQADCLMIVKNIGRGFCAPYDFTLNSINAFEIVNHTHHPKGLAAGRCDSIHLSIQLSENPDTLQYLSEKIIFATEPGFQMSDTIHLNVGNFGLEEDFEQRDFLEHWRFYDQKKNQWHRSSYRTNSGEYALYCGDEENQIYDTTITENTLESDWFYPGKEGRLSFYCWYEFPNYGTSGMSVEVYNEGEWEPLDFIGSGGALGILPTGNDWLKYDYDLTFLPDNEKTKLRFSVTIDAGEMPAEGIYIDDIQVIDTRMNFTGLTPETRMPETYRLYQNFPNPFNPATTIKFTLPRLEKVTLSVYNLRGELIAEIINHAIPAGDHRVRWSAKNLSSGIYFYKLEAGHYTAVKKSIYLK